MSVQQFCLRWNNHQPNFISVFSSLLHNETLVDVTLAADGSQLQAHKVVLSACSTYFESLFTSNPCQHPIVILKDVRYSDLKTLVEFMYYGEVNVSQERLPLIIKTAQMLKIKGLAEMSDAASLSKSESKSSSADGGDQMPPSTCDGDSVWGSTESQQFHHQHQQQQQQQHLQQQSHSSSCRSPSPGTMSPAARRKRLRKSSTGIHEYAIRKEYYITDDEFRIGSGSASTERTSAEEHSSMEGGSGTIHMHHMDPMSSFAAAASTLTSNINNAKMLKENSSNEPAQQETSQESVEESSSHHIVGVVMKTDDELSSVPQTMPLDITGSTSSGPGPSASCSQPQSHSGVQWTVVESGYPRFTLSSCQTNIGMPTAHNHPESHQHTGSSSNTSNNNNSNNNNSNNSSTNNNTNNSSSNATSGQTASVHMQYEGSPYSSQIISVNSYSQSTPTSPQGTESSMVQSVYSQGTTPNQSPIQMGSNQNPNNSQSSVPPKRKRSINPQGDENFIRALEAVRYGGIGFCKAARLFGVNNRTLWLEYKKRGYPISRPSIKNRIKLEPNISPQSPSTPTNEENTMENYEHIAPPSINMPIAPASDTPSVAAAPLMCPPHAHPMGVMSFLDTRHVEFPSALHPMTRSRYSDTQVNVNPTAMNLQGLNFNSM